MNLLKMEKQNGGLTHFISESDFVWNKDVQTEAISVSLNVITPQ